MLYDILNPYSNQIVTDYYLNIIVESLLLSDNKCNKIKKMKYNKDNRSKGIVVVNAIDGAKAKIFGYKKIILWSQGIIAEESYMRRKNKVRYYLLKKITIFAVKNADLNLLVSKSMLNYYENQYNISIKNFFIMPCFNEEIKKECFFENRKYKLNNFLYAGGIDPWQCFDLTLSIYKKIEESVDNAHILILVKEKEYANKMAKKYKLKNYTIDFVKREELSKRIKEVKYGFCIRKDDPINNVATPTKLSSYIANGIIPICSEYINDFYNISKKSRYCITTDNFDLQELIRELNLNYSIENIDIYNDFINVFGQYYSKKYYIEEIKKCLVNI